MAKDGASAARLANLGNARFRLKEYGPAILAYERAALLTPRDADLRANLKLARDAAKSPDATPDPRWWRAPLHWLSLHEWSFVCAGGCALLAAAVCVAAFSRKHRRPALSAALAALAFTGLSACALVHRSGERQLAIVTAAEPKLLLSPFPDADSAGTLSAGAQVLVEKTERGWHYVRTPGGGLRGWLPENAAGMVHAL